MFVAVSFFTISPQAAMWVLHNESLDLCKNTRTIITILSHIYPLSTIKGNLKSREERCKYKITPRRVME